MLTSSPREDKLAKVLKEKHCVSTDLAFVLWLARGDSDPAREDAKVLVPLDSYLALVQRISFKR